MKKQAHQKASALWLEQHPAEVTMLEIPESVQAIKEALAFAYESGYLRAVVETLENQS